MPRKNQKQKYNLEITRLVIGYFVVLTAFAAGQYAVKQFAYRDQVLGAYTAQLRQQRRDCKRDWERRCQKNPSTNFCVELKKECGDEIE